jgi:hypothetical protein
MIPEDSWAASFVQEGSLPFLASGAGSVGGTAGTLALLPQTARPGIAQQASWEAARQRLGMFAHLRQGWDARNAAPPSLHTIQFAAQELARLSREAIEAPTINPGADGSIYAHWHRAGLDIEVIFDGPYEVVLLVDDARGEVPTFSEEDPNLARTSEALRALARR